MRKTDNFELNLLDAEDFINREDLNENAKKIDEVLKEHDTPEYDITEQTKVEQLTPGESLKIALRKLAKAVADYISHKADVVAHITAEERTTWNAKLGVDKIAANLTTTTEGMVLAAAMGKTLKEQIDKNATDISTLNSNKSNRTEGVSGITFILTGLGSPCIVIIATADSNTNALYSVANWSCASLHTQLIGGKDIATFSLSGDVVTVSTAEPNPHITVIGN